MHKDLNPTPLFPSPHLPPQSNVVPMQLGSPSQAHDPRDASPPFTGLHSHLTISPFYRLVREFALQIDLHLRHPQPDIMGRVHYLDYQFSIPSLDTSLGLGLDSILKTTALYSPGVLPCQFVSSRAKSPRKEPGSYLLSYRPGCSAWGSMCTNK